jgi:hypothetical protein
LTSMHESSAHTFTHLLNEYVSDVAQ